MTRFRLLVTDVDGTIVGRSLRPSPRVRKAIQAAGDAGWQIALCTGRGPLGCAVLLDTLRLGGSHIFYNGSLVCDGTATTIIAERPLPKDAALRIVGAASAYDLTVELYTKDGLYVARRNRLTRLHSRTLGMEEVEADLSAMARQATVIKAELVVSSQRERDAVHRLAATFKGILAFEWAPIAGETDVVCVNVVAAGVSKASGMLSLASAYGIRPDDIVAVGDGPNDLSLIRAAGFGVAMGNAAELVRSEAAFVTGDVEEDGLATLVERLLTDEPLDSV